MISPTGAEEAFFLYIRLRNLQTVTFYDFLSNLEALCFPRLNVRETPGPH